MAEKHSIITQWKKGMAFETNINGHVIRMDAPIEGGGTNSGPGPKKLQLVSLSGCTGMDIVSILRKMHVEIESLNIEVQGELADEHPRHYTSMHVIYHFKGNNLPTDKLQKAVKMSEDTYCGVRALYAKAIPMTSEIRIEE